MTRIDRDSAAEPENGQLRGGYLTRGRADRLEQTVREGDAELQRQIDELRAQMQRMISFPIELAKLTNAAVLEAVKRHSERGGQ